MSLRGIANECILPSAEQPMHHHLLMGMKITCEINLQWKLLTTHPSQPWARLNYLTKDVRLPAIGQRHCSSMSLLFRTLAAQPTAADRLCWSNCDNTWCYTCRSTYTAPGPDDVQTCFVDNLQSPADVLLSFGLEIQHPWQKQKRRSTLKFSQRSQDITERFPEWPCIRPHLHYWITLYAPSCTTEKDVTEDTHWSREHAECSFLLPPTTCHHTANENYATLGHAHCQEWANFISGTRKSPAITHHEEDVTCHSSSSMEAHTIKTLLWKMMPHLEANYATTIYTTVDYASFTHTRQHSQYSPPSQMFTK